jgi:hypothetical protein
MRMVHWGCIPDRANVGSCSGQVQARARTAQAETKHGALVRAHARSEGREGLSALGSIKDGRLVEGVEVQLAGHPHFSSLIYAAGFTIGTVIHL